jgi:hypothetical protein
LGTRTADLNSQGSLVDELKSIHTLNER